MSVATAFGARIIMERLEAYGVRVERVVNCGGIAEKNPLVMQIYADVTGHPMQVSRSAQTCALGAAIFGAVVGGMIVGVTQTLTQQYISALSDIVLVVPFGIILVVLMVRPQGLFGTKRVERV
jgi:ribulose kinase